MKQKLAFILSAIMLITTLTACGGNTKKQATSSEIVSEATDGSTANFVSNSSNYTSSEPLNVTLVGDNVIKIELTTPLANEVIENSKYGITANFMRDDDEGHGQQLFQIEANNDGCMTYTASLFKTTSVERIFNEAAFADSNSENLQAKSEHIEAEISPEKIVCEFTYENIAEIFSNVSFVDINLQKTNGLENIFRTEWDKSMVNKAEPEPAEISENSVATPEQTFDTSFLENIYSYQAIENHTIKLTKVDADGNLVEFQYDGYTITLSDVANEYVKSEYHHFVRFGGSCPGYTIQIQYTYEDAPAETSQYPPDSVFITTGYGEGHSADMPLIIDGTFTK